MTLNCHKEIKWFLKCTQILIEIIQLTNPINISKLNSKNKKISPKDHPLSTSIDIFSMEL